MNIKDNDGHTTTPLRRAFYNLDTYTWKAFYRYLQENLLELLPEFFKQKDAQKTYINLEPIFDAYTAYNNQIKKFVVHQSSIKQLKMLWLELGKKQRELLPWHMLREFFRPGYSWNPSNTFDTNELPAPTDGLIYNWGSIDHFELGDKKFTNSKVLGFTLLRGSAIQGACANPEFATVSMSYYGQRFYLHATTYLDAKIFKQLLKTRMSELVNTISMELMDKMRFTNKS